MIYEVDDLLIGNKQAEVDVKKYIKQITQELVNSVTSEYVAAYLLGGGFGRGEGSVKLVNGEYRTTNDYDIIAICDEKISKQGVRELERKIETKYDLSFFEIDMINASTLKKMIKRKMISQSFYDLFKGCKLLWENEKYAMLDVRNIIKKYQTRRDIKIRTRSAFDVLSTRMWCIVALNDYNEKDKLFDDKYIKEFELYYFQQVKVATAIIDAVLISEKKYNSPCFKVKIDNFIETKFSKKYNTDYIVELEEGKLNNKYLLIFSLDNKKQLHNLYIKAIDYVISNHKLSYLAYLFKVLLKKIYYILVKKEQYFDLNLSLYKYIKDGNSQKLMEIQKIMREKYQ